MKQAALSLHHITRPPVIAGEGKPPLILLMHGIGSNEEDAIAIRVEAPPMP